MSAVACPRCNSPHDGRIDSRGWGTCRNCAYCWQPEGPKKGTGKRFSSSTIKPAVAGEVKSEEYRPEDSIPTDKRTRPLERSAVMKEEAVTSNGGLPPVPSAEIPVVEGFSDSKPPVAPLAGQGLIDSQLFDRMERDAKSKRSEASTVNQVEPDAKPEGGRKPSDSSIMGAPTATDIREQKSSHMVTCPICGHTFAMVGQPPAPYQTCPQCSTTFNVENGQLAADVDGNDDGEDFLIGRTIRGCFIDRKIGEGGMGSVYHAKQLSLDRSVALKVMPAELARNKNFIQRFEREAKSLAKINHPNILHIYDFGEDHALGIYFMIIEFVDGKDLGEILRERHTVSQIEMLDIIRQAAMGLEKAAEKGVIHRDIKPDNLMLSIDGICKVSDFGLAKGYGSLDEVTGAGVRVGTPAFMSPEQCDGNEIDYRADIYSLGCTAYLALTGALPFSGDSPFSIMLKHKTNPVPSLRDQNAEIDPRVDELVQRMLAKNPEERCRNLTEFIDSVESLQLSLAGGTANLRNSGPQRLLHREDTSTRMNLLRELPNGEFDKNQLQLMPELPLPRPFLENPTASPPTGDMPGASASPRPTTDTPPGESNGVAANGNQGSQRVAPVHFGGRPGTAAIGRQSTTEMLSKKGDDAIKRGESRDAVAAYQAALKRQPADADLRSKLATARKHQRLDNVDAMEAKGDELAANGNWDEAVDEWLRASQLSSQVFRREQLLLKVDGAQKNSRRRRLGRRALIFALLIALLVVNLWLWPPAAHNLYVDRQWKGIEPIQNEEPRLAALKQLEPYAKPFAWYVLLFKEEYEIRKAKQIRDEIARLQKSIQEKDPIWISEQEQKALDALKRIAENPSEPWQNVLKKAEVTGGTLTEAGRRAEAKAILEKAKDEIGKQKVDAKAVKNAWDAGNHAEALRLSGQFKENHPRAGDLEETLPLPTKLTYEGPYSKGMSLRVDGVLVVGDTLAIARHPNAKTVIDVWTPGYLNEHIEIAPDQNEATIHFHVESTWGSVSAFKQPYYSLIALDVAHVLIAGAKRIECLDVKTGKILGATVPPGQQEKPELEWSFVKADRDNNRLLAGTSDGAVLPVTWSAAGEATIGAALYRSATPTRVVDYLERQVISRPSQLGKYVVVQEDDGYNLYCTENGTPKWNQSLSANKLDPRLAFAPDHIFAIDDNEIKLFDEDGKSPGKRAINPERSGEVEIFTVKGAPYLAVRNPNGVDVARLGKRPLAITIENAEGTSILNNSGDCMLASTTDELLVVRPHAVQIWHWIAKGAPHPLERSLGDTVLFKGTPSLSDMVAAVPDEKGTIHLFARSDARYIRPYPLDHVPAVAPLVVGHDMIVLDADGKVTNRQVPEP